MCLLLSLCDSRGQGAYRSEKRGHTYSGLLEENRTLLMIANSDLAPLCAGQTASRYASRAVPPQIRCRSETESDVSALSTTLYPSFICSSEQAYGPIGSEHQAIGSKGLQHNVDIDGQLLGSPTAPLGFGHHAGDFAVDIRTFRKFPNVLAPAGDLTFFDTRLRQRDPAQISGSGADRQTESQAVDAVRRSKCRTPARLR